MFNSPCENTASRRRRAPKVPLIHVQQPAVKCPPELCRSHCSPEPIQVNFLRPAFIVAAAADADNCHVLKTATMHSLQMTNARGDLISRLCHRSKIPQTRWLFLPGTHADDRKHTHTSTCTSVVRWCHRDHRWAVFGCLGRKITAGNLIWWI